MSRLSAVFAGVLAATRQRANGAATAGPTPPAPAPGIPTTFDALYPVDWLPESSTTYLSRPVQSKPSTKATSLSSPSYTDQRFGTKIFRMTSVADASSASTHMRHEYSRRQPFNCDNTKFIAVNTKGHWWLYDAATFTRLDGGCTRSPDGVGALGVGNTGFYFRGDCEPFWHPTDPNKIWVTEQDGVGNIWYEFDIVTKTTSTLFDLNPLLSAIGWGAVQYTSFLGEGRPSDDGRWWGMSCMNNATNTQIGFIKYDRLNNVIVDYKAVANKPNNITTSASGEYVVPSWCRDTGQTMDQCAAEMNIELANGTRAYYNGFSNFRQLNEYGHHGDTARDYLGNDVWTAINYNNALMPDIANGAFYYRRMDNGVGYSLPVTVYSPASSPATHSGGAATAARPGWIVAETYAGAPGSTTYDEVVMAIELKPTEQEVLRLAHHQSISPVPDGMGGNKDSGYWAEPHTTVDRHLTRVVFASNFNDTDTVICESYMIGLPSWAIPTAGLEPMVRTANPTIGGTATAGGTLTLTAPGTFTGFPVPVVTGKWQISTNSGSNWSDISGETGSSYVIPGGTANGTQYRYNETGTQGATTSVANSNVATVAALAAPANQTPPSVPGTSADNSTTTATPGTWTGNPVPTISRKWQQFVTGVWTDSGLTSLTATLSAGTWRIGEQGANSQLPGGTAWVYSGSCVVAAVPQHIETVGPVGGATVTEATTTISANVGDIITASVVQIYGANPPRSITSVYDTVDGSGAAYSLAKSQVKASGNIRVDVYDHTVTTAGTRTIRSTLSATGAQSVSVTVRRGVTGRSGTASGADGTSTSVAPGSVTPTGSAMYHSVAATTAGYTTITKDAAYTSRAKAENGAPPVMEVSDKFGSGASNPNSTIGTSAEWVAVQVCYV